MSQQTPTDPDSMSRRQQFAATYRMAKQSDPRLALWLLGTFVVGAAVGFALFWFLPGSGDPRPGHRDRRRAPARHPADADRLRAPRAEGGLPARWTARSAPRANALKMLRRGWKVDPLIAFTKQQDVVHRVVGPPGIVLVGEGNPHRLRTLMTNERRKHERVVADTPIHEVVVGSGEGQVPLPKLVRHVQKLGRAVKPADLTDVLNRLKALDATRSNMPIPKGPVPTSMKGLRGQMRGR